MKKSGGKQKKVLRLKKKNALIASLLFFGITMIAIGGMFSAKSVFNSLINYFAAGEEPAHTKTRKPNEDGTYKLALTVTGEAEKQITKVNVIVIVDRSNSMNEQSGTGAYVASNSNSNVFGLVDGEFVSLTRRGTTYWYRPEGATEDVQYTGQRYTYDSTATRMQATKAAVDSLANSLLGYNGKDGNPNDTVQMALVQFGTRASTRLDPTNSATDFISSVNGITIPEDNNDEYGGATNWEAALSQANTINFGDSDPTYVIFFSDGAPTVRNSSLGYSDTYGNNYNGIYGTGGERDRWGNLNTENMNRAYNAATDDALTLANNVGADKFYTIFAYGASYGATYMSNLTTAAGAPSGNNYSASSTAELQDAFDAILEDIEISGIADAVIDDGTTGEYKISSSDENGLLMIDEGSYEFTITFPIDSNGKVNLNGKEATVSSNKIIWTDGTEKQLEGKVEGNNFVYTWTGANDLYDFAPEATNTNGKVEWDLSACDVLISNATYTVTFDVYPSQETYDLIADIKNEEDAGRRRDKYLALEAYVKKYLTPKSTTGDDAYFDFVLATNTNATLSYDDTRDTESTQTVDYNELEPVNTTAEKLKITKEWENALQDGHEEAVTIHVMKDGSPYLSNIQLTPTSKTEEFFISTGLMRVNKETGTIEVLDKGHDYTFKETGSESYNWELVAETVRPMLINNKLYKLIKIDDNVTNIYTEDGQPRYTKPDMGGKQYKKVGSDEYYEINGDIYVAVEDTGTSLLSATNYRRSNLNISKTVNEKNIDKDTEFTFKVNIKDTGATDDLWFSIMKEDGSFTTEQNITGTTKSGNYYVLPKANVIEGYDLVFKLKAGENLRFTNLTTKTTYTVEETGIPNDYEIKEIKTSGAYGKEESEIDSSATVTNNIVNGSIALTNSTYTVNYINKSKKINVTVEKKWEDETGDGVLPEEILVQLLKDGNNEGNPVTLTKNSDGKWIHTWTDLERYDGEREIDYDVAEITDKDILDHYESKKTGDMYKGFTITNTRRDDDISVNISAKKVWDDASNQDGIRPTSITFQLSDGTSIITGKDIVLDGTKDENGEFEAWIATFKELPKYKDGVEIPYTVEEKRTTVLNGTDGPGTYAINKTVDENTGLITITNKHTPETTKATVKKVWDDANDQDGKRPETLSVTLSDGTEVTLSETNSWTQTVTGLPKYKEGKEIEYTWTEGSMPEGYSLTDTSKDGTVTTLTNSRKPEETEATVKKVWDDANDQDGKRPEELVVVLENTSTEYKLTEATGWSKTVTGLPKYKDGKEIEYKWTEGDMPEGYSLTNTSKDGTVTTLTNSRKPEETEATVKKVWDDANNQDGKRPETLSVTLSDGTEVSLTEATGWSKTVTGLPKYKDGKEIEYKWTEGDMPEGYTLTNTSKEGTVTTLTNSRKPEETEATVKKVWDDANNQDGKRPEELVVVLENTSTEYKLTEATGWSKTVTGLPKYKDGVEIEYTWTEGDMPEGYSLTNTSKEGTITTLTNSRKPEETEATVKKVWDDANDQDGKRPETLSVTLSNGTEVTLTEANSWTQTVTGLPKYKDGEEIEYKWTEGDMPEGYSLTNTSKEGTVTTLTNSRKPEETEATVKKVWDDANNQDGKRPESLTVTLSNGTKVTLTEANEWTQTVTGLPKYANGVEIVYTWTEGSMPEGYTLTDTSKDGTITTLTNSRNPELTSATVKKVWDDANNQDGKRPESLTVTLSNGTEVELLPSNGWTQTVTGLPKYKDGKEIEYTWTEGDMPEGYSLTNTSKEGTVTTLTNSRKPEETEATVKKVWDDTNNQDGKRPESLTVTLSDGTEVTLNAANGWQNKVTELPKYKDGKEIEYTWTEGDMPEGYSLTNTSKDGTVTTLTNYYKPELTTISGDKIWDDKDNQDGVRPDSIVIILNADGEEVDRQTVEKKEDGTWPSPAYTFVDKPVYKVGAQGEKINYTITELPVDKYTSTPSGYDVTNTHNPFTTDISVKKVWNDGDNRDNVRPTEITVVLKADGLAISDSITLSEDNNWFYEWTGLNRFARGQEIEYTVEESGVNTDDYTPEITSTETKPGEKDNNDEDFTINNNHKFETVDVEGEKIWDDANDQDGIRSDKVTINLKADGEVIDTKEVKASDNWAYSWTNLPKYKTGKVGVKIEYSVDEATVPEGYSKSIDGYNIKNTHEPEKTEATVKKVWDDANDQDRVRPKSLSVTLSNGTEVTLTEANSWTQTVTGLPKYAAGKEIEYTWTEGDMPEGYSLTNTSKEGTVTTLTNSRKPAETEATVKKVWDDANDQDGKRPESLSVTLSNGTEVTLTEANEWTQTITGLPKYKDGVEIEYTWTEGDMPEGYSLTDTKVDGTVTTLTNSRTPELIDVPISKTWIDNNNSEGKRPESISVTLKADGDAVRTETITGSEKENNWKYTFKDLPKYKNGKEIRYTVVENDVDKEIYTVSYAGDRTIINTINDLKRDIPVTKIWDDNRDQDGKRPKDGLKITLIGTANIEGTIETPVNETIILKGDRTDESWTGKFEGLPIFHKGVIINYTINEELNGDDYRVTTIAGDSKNGYTITNTHTPEKTSIKATKIWDDADDNDGLRPETITIVLKDGDNEVGRKTISDADGWVAEFTDLTKYRDGEEIVYTVEEEGVDSNYISSIVQETKTITNIHTPLKITYEVTKIWDDFDNQDGKRPQSIKVTLYADGEPKETIEVKPDENGDWKYTFTDLPKYNAGKLIQYTITEEPVELYETDEITNVINEKTTEDLHNTITNRHDLIPYNKTGEITVTKIWVDKDNKNKKRPINITIRLLANGKEYRVATLSELNNWTYTFTDLPKYEAGKEGVEVVYTIVEDAVANYATTIDGFIVTNTYNGPEEPPVIEIIPPKTGIIEDLSNSKNLYNLLMTIIMTLYTLTIANKVDYKKEF